MHNDFGCSRLTFRALALPPQHPGSTCSLTSLLPASGGAAWLGERRQMIGLGRALTLESAAPDAIAEVRRAWEAAPTSATDPYADAARPGEATPASHADAAHPGETAPASSPVGGAPSPVLFASFAFRSPARSVAFVPTLTLIDEAGARWAITAGIGDAPDPLAVVNEALAVARPAPRVPESLTFGHGSMSRGQWRDSVRAMAQRLREGAADKAVMARDMTVRCAHGFDERFLLERLSDLYPSTWRFCVDSLLGASPEMLIAASDGTASSRVLAGTCKPGEGEMLASSTKDLREHDLASESVSSILTRLCSSVTTQGPFLLSLPNVVHLATDVHARLGEAHLLDLVATLHPTAAVCGTPRDAAMRLIEELEDTERGRYSGPVGWVDTAGDGEFAIALRCGLTSGTRLRLFAGAGIMPDSDPDAELAETEAKMRPLLDALGV